MDNGKQVTLYLEELAHVLTELHVLTPFHILISGGAYMLLQNKRRSTEDIDFAIVEHPEGTPGNETFLTTVKNIEVCRNTVPYSKEFKQAVEMIAQKYPEKLPEDWINDEAAVYYYDDAPQAEVRFWRSFEDILYVYLPTMEYVLATKIAAYRLKDASDIQLLIRELKVETREQAREIVDKFLLPDAQEFWEVDDKLEMLFP